MVTLSHIKGFSVNKHCCNVVLVVNGGVSQAFLGHPHQNFNNGLVADPGANARGNGWERDLQMSLLPALPAPAVQLSKLENDSAIKAEICQLTGFSQWNEAGEGEDFDMLAWPGEMPADFQVSDASVDTISDLNHSITFRSSDQINVAKQRLYNQQIDSLWFVHDIETVNVVLSTFPPMFEHEWQYKIAYTGGTSTVDNVDEL